MKTLLAALLGLGAGFVLHAALFGLAPDKIAALAASAALAAKSTQAQPPVRCVTNWSRVRDEVGSAVREALANDGGASTRGTTAKTAAVAPAVPAAETAAFEGPGTRPAAAPLPLTAEQVKAQEAKTELVEAALERGHWTEDDAASARRLLPDLSDPDRRDLLSKVVVAINSGKLKVDARRPF